MGNVVHFRTPAADAAADPHAGQPVLAAGPRIDEAKAVLVLVHGRGATAGGMVDLYYELGLDDVVAALAPQAAGGGWYPNSFLAPLESNQPYLDSAIRRLESLISDLLAKGTPSTRISILGFSQGACLALEFAARHAQPYGAIIGLSGGLIGPAAAPRNYAGSLDGTPVLLGSGDPDPHVPFERVRETAEVLAAMGARVDLRRYPGMPHTINQDELEACRELLLRISRGAT